MDAKTIYKDDFETSREVWIEADNERLTMYQQDLGPACRMMAGDDQYECEISCSLQDLMKAMSLPDEVSLLESLASMFSTADALDRFCEFLSSHSIKYDYYSC